jgi:hypothetical protein
MLANRNQPIVAGILGASIVGIVVATALPFNDRIEYRIGNRIESQPAWLVPPKAEFRAIERGYGGIKILLALLGNWRHGDSDAHCPQGGGTGANQTAD